MTAYVANHEKKNRLFAKRVRELVHSLKNNYSSEKVSIAAEKVRDAKMAAFKCVFAKSTVHHQHTFSPEIMAASDPEIQKWISLSTADIVEMYRTAGVKPFKFPQI